MARTLSHRGPDDEGVYLDGRVGLGHRRLSIIDLSTGRQPISNEDGSVWTVFNGEIYNFLEIRNQLIEQQLTDIDVMRDYYAEDRTKNDEVFRRYIGGFGMFSPTAMEPVAHPCCTANGAVGLYYAWHGITRFDDGVATVNLFLNRASPWMDVDSYLPYEGKVVLTNKKAHTALVRIPAWVDMNKLKCTLRKPWNVESEYHFSNVARPRYIDEVIHPARAGRHLLIRELKPGDLIQLEFPVIESTDEYFIHDTTYTVAYRGSTIVDIQPRETRPGKYPLYQRDKFKQAQAPLRSVHRYVKDALIIQGQVW